MVGLMLGQIASVSAETRGEVFEREIVPIIEEYCYDCHGDGSKKGKLSLDEYGSVEEHLSDHDLWVAVWKNLRSDIMPPSKKPQPAEKERQKVLRWIEREVFRLDPEHPDPGRVTIRRMNRVEYQNTIQDLVGVEFAVENAFPPDDTGYGFDTVGDVLSISPLLMEKYLDASRAIMREVIPLEAGAIPALQIAAGDLQQRGQRQETGRHMEFERDHAVFAERDLESNGRYRVELEFVVAGPKEAEGSTATVVLLADAKELKRETVGWASGQKVKWSAELVLGKGKRSFGVHLIPGKAPKEGGGRLAVELRSFRVRGPMEGGWSAYPESYRKIFFDGLAPKELAEQRDYARKMFTRFVSRAYRRPVEERIVERLVEMTMAVAGREGASFDDGIRQALVAVLASPRFLFRAEIQVGPDNPGKVVLLDEFSLASRLSYFLWSSLPDEELYRLAEEGKLRTNLREQVNRMLMDSKAQRFALDFTGQWLQARDMIGVHISARRILNLASSREGNRAFSNQLRRAMREETRQVFQHVFRENRPAVELIDANYTFLDEQLAKFYGIEGVNGEGFRRVELNEATHRGGILSQGTFLVVTSNPTRTSPVKRGLFVLDNLLGTPPPPAPADVPDLAEEDERAPTTMRERMVQHRKDPLCKSCHARMDPIGLGLENFNALGMWREKDGENPIDASGQLLTGEKFSTVQELKRILVTSRKTDFQRCLTEKMMTYAIGRGMEYYDGPTIDRIVQQAEEAGGGLREFVHGIVASAPFQMRRGDGGQEAGDR